VWEFLSNEQAVSVVWKYKHDLQEAANQLVAEAAKQWRKEEEVVDDITGQCGARQCKAVRVPVWLQGLSGA